MEFFLIYLLTSVTKVATLLKISGVFFWATVVFTIFGVFVSMAVGNEYNSTIKEELSKFKELFGKYIKTLLITTSILYTLGAILPTERDMALIIGGGLAYQAVTSDKGREVGGKAVELLIKKVDELLEEPKTVVKDVIIKQESL